MFPQETSLDLWWMKKRMYEWLYAHLSPDPHPPHKVCQRPLLVLRILRTKFFHLWKGPIVAVPHIWFPPALVAILPQTCRETNSINKPGQAMWLCPTKLQKMPPENHHLAFDIITWRVTGQQKHCFIWHLLVCDSKTTISNRSAYVSSRVRGMDHIILFNHKKAGWNSGTCYNMGELWKYDAKWTKLDTKR